MPANCAFLDYGSFIGVMPKFLLEHGAEKSPRCFAVEPNLDAISILREKLPQVEALQAEDEEFCRSAFPHRDVDVSLANSVLNTMSFVRSSAVLDKLCRISKTVIIGDSIQNLDGPESRFGYSPFMAQHPYRKMFSDRGFSEIEVIAVPDPSPQLEAWIIGRRGPQ